MAGSRPSPAILGALLLHAGVAAMFFIRWPQSEVEIQPTVSSVPVSIVSDVVIEAAAPDNPAEEPVTEEAATAPVEAPPAPTPPAPTPPAPSPPAPRPTPTPRPAPPVPAPAPRPAPRPTPPRPAPTPPRATPPAPTPARPTPPRPTPPQAAASGRTEPALDLDALAGPRRPAPTAGPRAPTGQQGQGRAPQATGPEVSGAILQQVEQNWTVLCDVAGGADMRITMDVTLSADGRITRGPTLVNPRSEPAWRAQADGALRAMRQTAPFDVPAGFEGGSFRPTFVTARMCGNR